jgi:hypothetical protein
MFPPRYHGTIFNVTYEPQGSQKDSSKTAVRAHLITSLDTAELFQEDYTTSVAKFRPADIDRLENRKTSVFLTMRPGCQTPTMRLSTHPESSDSLNSALTQILAISKPEIRFLAMVNVLPTCKFPSRREEITLHKGMMDIAAQIVQSLGGPKETNGQFVDAVSCVYRMRYRNSNSRPMADCIQETGLNVGRRLVVVWCDAIARAAEFVGDYFSKLIVNLSATIVKIANTISISADELTSAAREFDESGEPGVGAIAARISGEAEGGIDADLAESAPCDTGNFVWILDLAVIALAGIIAEVYPIDIENFAEEIVRYWTGDVMMKSSSLYMRPGYCRKGCQSSDLSM